MFLIQRDLKQEKGIGSCLGEKKEHIQIIQTYKMIFNFTHVCMIV